MAENPKCAPRSSTSSPQQKGPVGLFIRIIGQARATTKIGLANLVYNMKRMAGSLLRPVPV